MFGRPTKCSNEPASIIRGSLHWLSKAESVHTHTHARTHTHTLCLGREDMQRLSVRALVMC
jgi:hypothetical protein